jgi:hypothetical protein
VSRIRGVLELQVPAETARGACLQALTDLGWHIEAEEGGEIGGHEEACELPCHVTPATASLSVAGDAEHSAVTIETRVPGLGPISASHARGRQEALVRRVHAAATG